MVKRAVLVVGAAAALVWSGSAAYAAPDHDVFDSKDQVWSCGGSDADAPVPPDHCINTKSFGTSNVGMIMVFDDRWPQESISLDPKANRRPCPHDPAAEDGTWWEAGPGVYVCHHRP